MIRFYREGILKNIVPLMLCVSIVSSCMYVYSKEFLPLFVLIAVVIQASVFSFYSYISEKSLILRFISILGSFLAIGAMVMIAIKTGNNKSSIDYFVWFLSPQALVDFSFAYISATFIIINFFIASTVYYFSAVRYRISMTFLITLIPFAVYRKEGTQVPVFFALLLLVMYMALMIHCRQINTKPRQKMIVERGYKRSMAVFLAFTALLALALPKPDLGIDNSWVDTAFESDRITKYMLERLGIVADTATSSVVYSRPADIKIYDFKADEHPVNLKSQTYSEYIYSSNLWKSTVSERKGKNINSTYAAELNPEEFYKAVAAATNTDEEFSKKYGLGNLPDELNKSYSKTVSMISSRVSSQFYYSPVLVYEVSDAAGPVLRSPQGMIYSDKTSGTKYSVHYYSDSSLYEKNMQKIVKLLDNTMFGDFLDDMNAVFEKNNIKDFDSVMKAYRYDYDTSMKYLEESYGEMPEFLNEFVQNIVRKKTSDYDRAQAIEEYFRLNDYVYSLDYRKPKGYNMEYFLTEGKTGICSDYATAMVLLARAAGIPARYAEGIHLHDPDEDGIITVRDSDLHAFPELYISGFGWKSFEPTQLGSTETKSSFDYRMSVMLAIAAFLIIVFVLFFDRVFYPWLSEEIFNIRLKKATDEKAVEMTVTRLIKKLGLENSCTSSETGKYVLEMYGVDMSGTVADFDRIVYGGGSAEGQCRENAVNMYHRVTELIAAEKKANKKFR